MLLLHVDYGRLEYGFFNFHLSMSPLGAQTIHLHYLTKRGLSPPRQLSTMVKWGLAVFKRHQTLRRQIFQVRLV